MFVVFKVKHFEGKNAQMADAAPRARKAMTQAISVLFELLKNREKAQIWLYENTSMKLEGTIIGFDEYMNIVLDSAEELYVKSGERKPIGRIMLKGDCITLIQKANP